jgi:hypothetical protein
MSKIKDDLKVTNEFTPNLSSLNPKETSLFGSIKLDGFWFCFSSFKSEILTNEQQCFELINLCEFSPSVKWTLLYRGTRDGFDSNDFHSRCDGRANTLTILKAKESSYIFGGFTSVSWESSTDSKWKSDPSAFIFSLTNKDNRSVKMKIGPNRHDNAIYCSPEYGPTFGCGFDICIGNTANTAMDSYSYLGTTYSHPQYLEGTNEAETFLAGSYSFKLVEIEVYQKE